MITKGCEFCSVQYRTSSPTSRFCSNKCRQAAHRQRNSEAVTPQQASVTAEPDDSPPPASTSKSVRAQLEQAGRSETYLGQAAIALAERIDSSRSVMGFAALVKELRVTMDAALAGVKVAEDPIDELRARRDRKRRTG